MSQPSFYPQSSTPAFAPPPSTSFSSNSYSSSSSSNSPPSSSSRHSLSKEPVPSNNRAVSPHSSCSSIGSTASSSSPSSSASFASSTNLNMSSTLPERGRTRSGKGLARSTGEGSVGSLATTVSPGTDAIKEDAMEGVVEEANSKEQSEAETKRSGNGDAINLETLSIRQPEEEEGVEPQAEKRNEPSSEREGEGQSHSGGGGNGKFRRASDLSPGSAISRSNTDEKIEGNDAEGKGSKGGKRKAAKTADSEDAGRSNTPSASGSNSTAEPSLPSLPTPQPPTPTPTSADSVEPNTTPSSVNHVEIVTYPSNDLLRLLASLLEQIAQANDARNVRFAAQTAATSPSVGSTPSGSAPSSMPSTRRNSLLNRSEDDHLSNGRFDAAPLNSPVTPHHARRFGKIGGLGGPGILDNALDENDEAVHSEMEGEDDEMPLTPGVDLLREVGEGGGVEGFMPSLGGTHQPMPLGRRRGSSFIRNKRPDESSIRPSASRQPSVWKKPPNPCPSSLETPPAAPLSRSLTATPQPNTPIPSPPTATNATSPSATNPSEPPLTSLFSASSIALSSPNATLCFHARNVPAISIEAYLLRILKYCPTTNEVFLALLVYFDRMARIGLEAQRLGLPRDGPVAGQDAEGEGASSASQASKLFAIDSFNVHRLVIAGVTVASKFFSDVFYTNSRYAKVGGLPLHELNQLELQFLLLNDFRLKIPTDELQRYADQLILFWIGRNGTSNPPAAAAAQAAASSSSSSQPPSSVPSSSTPDPRCSTPTHAPAPSSMNSPARLTHSAVAAHHQSSAPSSSLHQSTTIDPRTPTVSTTSSASKSLANRPRSIRSQPSSSGTSVTSTITPGTPSTTRGGSSSCSDDDEGDASVRARGRFAGRSNRVQRVEPSEDGHYHDGWSSNEASSRDSSAERDERDRRDVDRRLSRDDRMQED